MQIYIIVATLQKNLIITEGNKNRWYSILHTRRSMFVCEYKILQIFVKFLKFGKIYTHGIRYILRY